MHVGVLDEGVCIVHHTQLVQCTGHACLYLGGSYGVQVLSTITIGSGVAAYSKLPFHFLSRYPSNTSGHIQCVYYM